MSRINKFSYLSGVFIFYCCSAIAIDVEVIDKNNYRVAEYERISYLIENIAPLLATCKENKKEQIAILRVYFDGVSNGKYLSSKKCNLPGSMSPEDFFRPNLFEQEAAELLRHKNFPLDKFHFSIILSKGMRNIEGTRNNLEMALKKIDQKPKDKDILVAIERFKEYLSQLQKIVGMMQNAEFLFCRSLVGAHHNYTNIQPTEAPKSSLEDDERNILDTKRPSDEIIAIITKTLPEILPLFVPLQQDNDLDDGSLKELRLRLYCKYWGSHAEDALIYKMLLGLKEDPNAKIPKVIEIYGNKDPCFQCQIKLQWLVDLLANEDHTDHIIHYYSREEFTDQCLYVDLPQMVTNCFTTRKPEEKNKIKKFTFVSGKELSHPLELFVAPYDILEDFLKDRMLSGEYEGKIIQVEKIEERIILQIKITKILRASLACEQDSNKIHIEQNIPVSELDKLKNFYNKVKKVYILLPQSSTLDEFKINDQITFRLSENNKNIEQKWETNLVKRDGNFGEAIEAYNDIVKAEKEKRND